MQADDRSIREAWSRIPSPVVRGEGHERHTGDRIERILHSATAVGSAALGIQAFLAAITGPILLDGARVAMMVLVFGPLIAMIAACVAGRWVKATCGVFSVTYALGLLLWPVIAEGSVRTPDSQPWIFFLVNIAVAAAMLAFRLPVQFAWAIGLPLIYGYVRLEQGEFTRSYWITTAFDVSFTLILGMVIVSLGWMLRQVARGVDDARSQAVASYAAAAAATAAEEERVAMAALMHDSVLAALIAAERAGSDRERALATAMAREALTRLANTEGALAQEGNDEPVTSSQIVVELRRALSELGADAIVEEVGPPARLPERVARAIVLAARQAIGNALQHAGGRGLHVVVESVIVGADPDGGADAVSDGIRVVVSDRGDGFDPEDVGEDRLGIRASIVARMAAVAGASDIRSGPDGTDVSLSWSAR